MNELRSANIIFSKNGHGSITTKITVPVGWIKELGFTENDKKAIIEILNDKIIIRKEMINMIKVKNSNVKFGENYADYELENGVLLFLEDWNGEIYGNGFDKNSNSETNCEYRPVYRFQLENIDIAEIEENSDEWYRLNEIVGFED